MPLVSVNGLSLYYEEKGIGRPLVCISGLAAGHESWTLVQNELTDRFRVATFDNRGMGKTSAPDEPYSIDQMADDTAALMSTLGMAAATVVGHSMGSAIALRLALRHPERVDRLVLCSAFIRIREAALFVFRTNAHLLREGVPVHLAFEVILPWLFSDTFFRNPDMVRSAIEQARSAPPQQSLAAFERQIEALAAYDAGTSLKDISIPVLVMAGAHDIMTPPSEARRMAEDIPHARFETVEAGHMGLIEDPKTCAKLIADFSAA